MRTIIRLDDDLLREAKAYAAATDRTLTQLIDEALREALARRRRPRERPWVRLPTVGGAGPRPGGQSGQQRRAPRPHGMAGVILPDVNVLVYAHREGADEHEAYRDWLEHLVNGDETYAVSDVVLSGFVRVVTNRRIFDRPSTIDQALAFAERLVDQPNCVWVRPGERHWWKIFTRLCRETVAAGNLVPDAFLAALTVENGCELATTDGDFARFKGLRWRHPLA